MTYDVTIRYRSGRSTKKVFSSWGEINEFVRGLGKEALPLSTVLTVRLNGATERYSVRGGGDIPVKLIRLATVLIIPGGKKDPEITLSDKGSAA